MPTVHIVFLLLLSAAVNGATAQPQGRLLEGKGAEVGSHPYSVSVQRNGAHVCGGALISAKVCLTAAHCVTTGGIESYPARTFLVRAGSIQRLAGGQLAQVDHIKVHKGYANGLNNVALMVLQQPLTLNANTQPIALASEVPPSDAEIIYTGWGAVSNQGASSQRMLVGSRKAISAADCQKQLYVDHEGLLCLVSASETIANGICHNDAGAPAVYKNELVGIGSFFVDVCGSLKPNGFMSIPYYRGWIIENM
ncbi:serine protease SP24D [Drosophila grimshawi]|uniref:trypsin n=1 Tax=Drosophila grimshawi TaxID=7222 RepID=B4JIV6_DROGR|nr:serine protease SP24D [Drosophila grimshawi]EDV99520.1 GH12394 [Drosophila grimshawi]